MGKFSFEEYKINWRKNWLISLLSLADFDLQKDRWLNKAITNPAWSYVEFMSVYFDDLQIDNDLGYKSVVADGRITLAEYECIKDFHEALSEYKAPGSDPWNEQAIIEDEKWRKVVALGVVSMKKLEALITDEQEKEIFSKKLYAPELTSKDFTWPN